MKRRTFIEGSAAGTLALIVAKPQSAAAAETSALEEAFKHPPASAGAKTWWHWMNGNVTADGITRDLEAMKRVGISGFQIFDVGTGIPKGPVEYLSAEWLKLMQHAAAEADRLGLQFEMHNCPGWSSSGGPWITPELAMQLLVWSETYVRGGQVVDRQLPQPPTRLGYYKDACVLAFPSLPGETRPLQELLSGASTSGGPLDVKGLFASNRPEGVELRPATPGEPVSLQLDFVEPFEARSIAVYSAPLPPPPGTVPAAGGGPGGFGGVPNRLTLEVSDDGSRFRQVLDVGVAGGGGGGGAAAGAAAADVPSIASLPAVKARHFRLTFTQARRVVDVKLCAAGRIRNWTRKANFVHPGRGGAVLPAEPEVSDPSLAAIDPSSVLDIGRHMDAQGRLSWTAPAGDWTILRFGHTARERRNNAAPDTGLGLECDKFSRAAYEFHFNKMFERLLPALRPLAEKGRAGVLVDSYEVGMQNWTAGFPQEFRKRRGYELLAYLPAMTGRVVGSADVSERFLWDVRRVQADVIADNYYGRFAELCRQHGIKSYTEPYDGGPFEEMQIGSRVDTNMGEFWIGQANQLQRSVKLAASIAHVFGQPIVGAESFTATFQAGKWQEYPYRIKALGDWMYTQGLNQFIFHRYALQPHPDALPGMTMGPWGSHFDRTNTWFEQGRAWLEYVSRCQSLLRQGLFVADLLYFVGEDAPADTPDRGQLDPELPAGHDYDTVNAGALKERVRIADGRIVLPDGMSYRVLVLPDKKTMTLDVLRKIRDLVEQGLCLVGPRPERTPSLAGYPQSETELSRIAAEVWGNLDGKTVKQRSFGKGRVFWGEPLRVVLDTLGVAPDFHCSARASDAPINYIHRRVGDADVYFVANRRRRSEDLVCTFRVSGRRPELWNPDNGETSPLAVYEVADSRTRVPLRLGPAGSAFVVFRNAAEPRQVKAVLKDGTAALVTDAFPEPRPGLHPTTTNDFTVGVWVKPDTDIALPSATGGGPNARPTCFVFFPLAGESVYGEGHAACGMTAGRNGVSVYERARASLDPVLTVPTPLAGWTHVALVYRGGAPSLYLNGAPAGQGKASGKRVHPGLGEAHQRDGAYYFEGHMGEPQLFPEALAEDRIRQLAAAALPLPEEPPALEHAGGARPELLFWQDGSYSLRDNMGRSSAQRVAGLGRPIEIGGPWRVSFPPNLGAPAEISLPQLMSLHKHAEPGVRYFSGTATYGNGIRVPADAIAGDKRLVLDLGWLEVIGEVRVNRRSLGILWKPPFRIDITDAVRPGENELQVLVTNLWPNRLIGDEQLPAENEYGGGTPAGGGGGGGFAAGVRRLPDWYAQGRPKPPGGRVTFTTWKHYDKASPLLESGLIGPVRLRNAVRRAIG
jgi:hypothetical protein